MSGADWRLKVREGRAYLVREPLEGFNGHAGLYRLDPPVAHSVWDEEAEADVEITTEYVIASSIVAISGPETLVFPATAEGRITSFREVDGVRDLSHERALERMGYRITIGEEDLNEEALRAALGSIELPAVD